MHCSLLEEAGETSKSEQGHVGYPDTLQQTGEFVTDRAPFHADVMLITVNEHETQAVHAIFGAEKKVVSLSVNRFAYIDYGHVNGARVVHTISGMGATDPGAMRDTTTRALKAFRPWAVVAVGIAWGANEDDQKIGDILVSQHLHLGGHKKIKDGVRKDRGPSPPASDALRNLFLTAQHLHWQGAPVEFGPLISEETLFDDRAAKEQALLQSPGALGGEMEGTGMYGAARRDTDWIVVKAICDWGYKKQNADKEAHQRVAARNAAAFVHAAISNLSFAPSNWQRLHARLRRLFIPFALASIAVILLGLLAIVVLKQSGGGVTLSYPYIRLTKEAFLGITFTENLFFKRDDPARGGYTTDSPFHIVLTYPRDAALIIYDWTTMVYVRNHRGNYTFLQPKCEPPINEPLKLSASLASIVKLKCTLSLGAGDAIFEPASGQHIESVFRNLPNWGVGWLHVADARLEIKFKTAEEQEQILSRELNLVLPPLKEPDACNEKSVRELLKKLERQRGQLNRDDLAARLGAPSFRRSSEMAGNRLEGWYYFCNDVDKGDLPTCTMSVVFNSYGIFTSYGFNPINEVALKFFINKFEEQLSALDFAREEAVAVHLGQPYLRLGDWRYYRLPQAPENVLFGRYFQFGRMMPLPYQKFIRQLPWLDTRPCEATVTELSAKDRRALIEAIQADSPLTW